LGLLIFQKHLKIRSQFPFFMTVNLVILTDFFNEVALDDKRNYSGLIIRHNRRMFD